MAMIVILSAKASPGVTTSVAALTSSWPTPVLAVGADPSGDDLLTGWLGESLMNGWIRPDRGLLAFATATRHAEHVSANDLRPYIQAVPSTKHARVVTGLLEPSQAASVGHAGWQRLAQALADVSRPQSAELDVLVDGGRFGSASAWPLLYAADLVLVAVRPDRRFVLAARPFVSLLRTKIAPERLGLAVSAGSHHEAHQVSQVLALPLGLRIPDDARSARWFLDGTPSPSMRRSKLLQAVQGEARRLHGSLNAMNPATPAMAGAPA
jgi:hypothetical protein